MHNTEHMTGRGLDMYDLYLEKLKSLHSLNWETGRTVLLPKKAFPLQRKVDSQESKDQNAAAEF